MKTQLKLLNVTILIFSACLLTTFAASANDSMLKAKSTEIAAVTSVNAAYYDAFKASDEDNWVYQLREQKLLEPKCYLSKKEPFAIGAKYQYQGLDMECIQVGQSTRIFWPTRWVNHCQQVAANFGLCVMNNIDIPASN